MRLRTVGVKLSLALVALVAGALAIVYLAVVPGLENRLVDNRISQLQRAADAVVLELVREDDNFGWDALIDTEAQRRGVGITIYAVVSETSPIFLSPFADSRPLGQTSVGDAVAHRAVETERTQSGVVERANSQIAEVAVPFGGAYVLLVSSPLDDTLENVTFVRERLLVAGLVALLAATIVGFLLARVFARRIHRLERAAERIAGGHFDQPVVDKSEDELGELAAAFDRMREQLAALERARREFIANASHELRTPIFALGGHIELLTDEEMGEATRRDFLAEMRVQVERLTKLATDLLDLSRLDAGRLHVELAPVDLGEIAESLAAEFVGVGRGHDHALVAETPEGTVALADEERVRQIGRILLENAILHTPAGTEVRLTADRVGDGVALRVEDNGPGIPEDDQPHVFERFYRAGGAITSGSGLGLAIAQELAAIMGGEIKLASRPGRTVFTLRLPRARVPTPEAEPALSR
jgi:signal transduction histidine kinase